MNKTINIRTGFKFHNSIGSLFEVVNTSPRKVFYQYVNKERSRSIYDVSLDKLRKYLKNSTFTSYNPLEYEEENETSFVNGKIYLGGKDISTKIQKKAFELGYKWMNGSTSINPEAMFLFLNSDGHMSTCASSNYFHACTFKRLYRDAFLNSKQLINPSNTLNNEANYETKKSEHRITEGTAIKGSCEKNRITSSSRLVGNTVKNRRVEGKTISSPIAGGVLLG